MATTVTDTRKDLEVRGGRGSSGSNGKNGKNGNDWKHNGDEHKPPRPNADKYRITVWVLLAAVLMMFVALSSAYIVLAAGDQGHSTRMPRVFFLSTVLILASSVTMESAKRSLRSDAGQRYARWLILTLVWALAFVASQLVGWRRLANEGVYFSGHPHSSFFFLFTGLHAVHLLGGMFGLTYLVIQATRLLPAGREKAQALTEAASLYWHFMDGLWIYLFVLLLLLG